MKKILNQTEAADYIGVSRRTIHSWRKNNVGPKFTRMPGGRPVTTLANLDKFLAELSE